MFIDTDEGWVNSTQVTCIEQRLHRDNGHRVKRTFELANGKVQHQTDGQLDIDMLNITIVPAQSGFVLCHFFEEDQSVDQKPIIAWAINPLDRDGGVTPITVDGLDLYIAARSAVLQPDGKVVELGGTSYPSVEDWREAKVWRAEQAAKSA